MTFSTLKRKIEEENRRFNPSWTDKYLFILPPGPNAKPKCLLCNECVAVLKDYNVWRHHTEKHATFRTNFPEGSHEMAAKIQSLTASYNRSCTTMKQTCTAQERATAASLRVSWILAKKNRPFTESETVKDCMLAVVDKVLTDDKVKKSVTSAIKQVPLSDTSNIRRVDILVTDVFETLLKELRKADNMAVAVDESTDRTDTAQLCMYVRFFDGNVFKEELLGLLPLDGQTTGEILFEKISSFFDDNDLDMKLVITDGDPSMAGKVSGLAARWSAVAPQMTTLHCIVHQTVLCAKLSDYFEKTMDNVMAIINFIRSTSSLQHRIFHKALERFCDLKEEITAFLLRSKLKRAETYLTQILDDNFMADVCFLCDIFRHLNHTCQVLDLKIREIFWRPLRMGAFQVNLDIFTTDLGTGRMLHFPTLRKCISSTLQITDVMTGFIARLKENFTSRLDRLVLPTDVMSFAKNPFTAATHQDLSTKAKQVVPSIDEGKFILELVDMQSSQAMAHSNGPARFCPLAQYGSSYTCESSFSHMNMIKNSSRCSLTDSTLNHCLRIALTSFEPNIHALVQNKRCHFSY
uniref:DUF4371 domain-containing protein n=1 Tax=Gouania willdenowi TaxID=441366 RepID=A0A8C5N8A0_GOUWI